MRDGFVIEIEQHLLGAVLSGGDHGAIFAMLDQHHFIEPAHQIIFDAARQAYERYSSTTIPVVLRLLPGDFADKFKAETQQPIGLYPPDFEAAWLAYPTDANMSKAKTLTAWLRLDVEDRAKVAAAIPAFMAFCRKDATYRPVHMVRFISERRFDGFVGTGRAKMATVDDWERRLQFGRKTHQWSSSEWGLPPNDLDTLVPREMIEPGDGVGWSEWKIAS